MGCTQSKNGGSRAVVSNPKDAIKAATNQNSQGNPLKAKPPVAIAQKNENSVQYQKEGAAESSHTLRRKLTQAEDSVNCHAITNGNNTEIAQENVVLEQKDEELEQEGEFEFDLDISVKEENKRKRLSVVGRTDHHESNIDTKTSKDENSNNVSRYAMNKKSSKNALNKIRTLSHEGSIGNGAQGEKNEVPDMPINFACLSRPGNDPAKRQKENQDTYCVSTKFNGTENSLVTCVYDGHGPNGKLASHYVRDTLLKIWKDNNLDKCKTEEEIRKVLHNGCVDVNHRLAMSNIDVYVSGSTGILSYMKDNVLYVANVGDSRAVLARLVNGNLVAIDLSDDQKPDRPDEEARILRNGGRVFEWGVPRVWRKEVDMPGLAMARSFGDLAAESVGVIADPEITRTELTSNDKFVILASDGVWEFLSSQDAVDMVGKCLKKSKNDIYDAAVHLVKQSVKKWHTFEDVVDDTTCVILSLDF